MIVHKQLAELAKPSKKRKKLPTLDVDMGDTYSPFSSITSSSKKKKKQV